METLSKYSTYLWVAALATGFGILWRMGYLTRVRDFVLETREELRKCSWPTMEELKDHTVVVLFTILLLGAFTVLADLLVRIGVWDLLLGANI